MDEFIHRILIESEIVPGIESGYTDTAKVPFFTSEFLYSCWDFFRILSIYYLFLGSEFKSWDEGFPIRDIDTDFIVNLDGISYGFWHMGEKFLHFIPTPEGIIPIDERGTIRILE